MHLLAERCILKGLKAAGVVTGDVEEMLSARIGALFMPHGAVAPSHVSETRSLFIRRPCCDAESFVHICASCGAYRAVQCLAWVAPSPHA